MPAANDEKKPLPEEAAPPPWSLDPIAGDLRGVKRAAAQQRESRACGRERVRVWVWGGSRSGYLRIGEGRRGAERSGGRDGDVAAWNMNARRNLERSRED